MSSGLRISEREVALGEGADRSRKEQKVCDASLGVLGQRLAALFSKGLSREICYRVEKGREVLKMHTAGRQ